jgi:hypothetical protein
VGTYLLDPDGHRLLGRFTTLNFSCGFGAVKRGSESLFRAQQASQQVRNSPGSLTLLGDGRLQYEFREDLIVIRYFNPSRADQEQTMWLGNFDMLESPVHNGTHEVPQKPVVASWLYLPHPTYRQGVLLRLSKTAPVTLHLPPPVSQADGQAAVQFPVPSGDELSLAFTTREELTR